MADKRIRHTWSVKDAILSTIRMAVTLTFDISKIFPKFADLGKVEQFVAVYGLKQILADSCAGLEEKDHKSAMDAKWSKLLSGDLTIHRAGFTSFETKKQEAWDKASPKEQAVLRKLGLAPKAVVEAK